MISKKRFLIYNEAKGGYWDRVAKKFKPITKATKYESKRVEDIEAIILNDDDLPQGYFSVKTIIIREKEEND